MAKPNKRRKKRRDTLILKLLILVAAVLVLFEGRLVTTMISFQTSPSKSDRAEAAGTAKQADTASSPETEAQNPKTSSHAAHGGGFLAGLSGGKTDSTPSTETPRHDTVSDPDSPAIVREAAPPVDDSYFSDAVFIGDSRMEGFRNASGITQGTFLTSVGMSLDTLKGKAVIPTAEGEKITVAAALSGIKYGKVYIMLGANDLGEYDWDSFREGFTACLKRFQELQPDALFYLCSCIYVEESKVTSGNYVNNTNVDTLNAILLEICEELGCGYLDLNEILSDGYGSLIQGASSDGVHLYGDYCKQMLTYLKSHFLAETGAESPADSEAQTEGGSGSTEDTDNPTGEDS